MFRVASKVLTFLFLCWMYPCVGRSQDDPIDVKRSERYVERLEDLQKQRDALKTRSSSLMAQTPYLQEELSRATQKVLSTSVALASTPELQAIPRLFQSYGGILSNSSQVVVLRPQYLLWYSIQDNTLFRNQLMFQLRADRQLEQTQLANYLSTLNAIDQLSRDADDNFEEFRHLADLMGRRSKREIADAQSRIQVWLQDEPQHAGAGLISAYALRSEGRFDEANRLLDRLDDNYNALQVIRETVAAQIAFLGGDDDKAHERLTVATRNAKAYRVAEPLLLHGWLYLAQGDFNDAKQQAARYREIVPGGLEGAILESLVMAYQKPKQAKDALRLLRSAQLHSSPDDWHYHEALAIVHSIIGDRVFAEREMQIAVANAPSHVRPDLEAELAQAKQGKALVVDWRKRLNTQWLAK